jgi:hypothetical protein
MANKGIVYKIEIGDELYIGSTEEKLCKRQGKHNYDLKKKPHRKLYKACIDNGINKIKCWWVADIIFNSFEERRAIEETYRKELNAKLNSLRCYSSKEEKEEYQKQYKLDHKEKIAEYKKQYDIKYNLDHKEKIAERNRLYNIKNRDTINAKARAKRKEKKLLKEKSS